MRCHARSFSTDLRKDERFLMMANCWVLVGCATAFTSIKRSRLQKIRVGAHDNWKRYSLRMLYIQAELDEGRHRDLLYDCSAVGRALQLLLLQC